MMEERTMKKIVALVLCLALALALCTVAFAGTVEAPYYGKDTQSLATYSNIQLNYVKAAEPTVKDGQQVDFGNIAYYDLDELGCYTAVDSLAKADLVVYSDKDMKNVVLYLAELDEKEIRYIDAKVYTNFGTKCGQCSFETEKDATYYSANVNKYGFDGEILFKGCKAEDAQFMVRVAGKFVPVQLAAEEITLVGHTAVPVLENGKVVGYKCANCGLAAVEAPNTMSIPAKATVIAGNWYFPAAAAAAASTGVTSAKTFDAGVAMYAGLALMSVAGSAVVIGKKKEF
jgi:hypothetical protein